MPILDCMSPSLVTLPRLMFQSSVTWLSLIQLRVLLKVSLLLCVADSWHDLEQLPCLRHSFGLQVNIHSSTCSTDSGEEASVLSLVPTPLSKDKGGWPWGSVSKGRSNNRMLPEFEHKVVAAEFEEFGGLDIVKSKGFRRVCESLFREGWQKVKNLCWLLERTWP